MTRPLKETERAVLAHVVIDPDAWWAHVQATFDEKRAEAALSEKVERWRPSYVAAAKLPDYVGRAERERRAEATGKRP